MTLRYSRWSPPERVPDVEAHVRAHLSSVADPGDDPATHADAVRVTTKEDGNGLLVTGELDTEASAPYLLPDFTPEADIAANPLTIEVPR
ncbi:MAG: hypothetical protein WBA97_22575 [Actinophytocola sp.]|uniref:hypothetical protein n=1 Tax=Actinophytocola sp. TaxID=1872138 RepID=UPI003C721DC9